MPPARRSTQPVTAPLDSAKLPGPVRALLQWYRRAFDVDALAQASRAQRLLARYVRVLPLVFRLEVYNRIDLQAQALTMKTLLGLVPMLVVLFSVVTAFGGLDRMDEQVQAWIVSNLSASSDELKTRITDLVVSVQAVRVGGTTIVILLVTVLSLIGNIENAINSIFGVTTQRPAGVRLVIYWSVFSLGSILLSASLALTAAMSSSHAEGWLARLGDAGTLMVKAAPLMATWLAFATLYFVIPATRVRLSAALFAAVVAGSLWNIAKYGYAYYARTNVTVKDIYGSLAAFPMFILWLYVSWLLVLFGAQLCFAFQHAKSYRPDHAANDHAPFARERAACRLLIEVGYDFLHGLPPTRPEEVGERLGLGGRLLERTLSTLRTGGFVRDTDDGGLLPARALEQVSLEDLLGHLHERDGSSATLAAEPGRAVVDEVLASIQASRRELGAKQSLRDLVGRLPPPDADRVVSPS